MSKSAEQITKWREHPAEMVRDLFNVSPDPWQEEVLEAFPHHQRICMKASKGVGKTTCEAWLILNFLLTRPHPKIAATAISGANLSDNLWTELALWVNRSQLLSRTFTWTKTRIFAKDHPETWWCSARAASQTADKSQQANTLAGLHADYIMFVLDESGSMPEAIMASAEAALSSCKEGHIVQAGNPTVLSGPLYTACTSQRRLWYVVDINGDPDNPKRATRVSVQWAREQIEKYGRNNPYVLVNVFGQFPPSSINVLIGPDEVSEAMKRFYRPFQIGTAAKIIAADVARFGDDSSVLAKREGIQMYPFDKKRNIDSTQGAGWVARVWDDWGANACFVDATGGYGAGWIDQLNNMGRDPIGVQFAGEAHEKSRYFNKRAEMAFEFVEWIKRGGGLPECPELLAALTQTTYTFYRDRFLLEPKEDIKIKLGYSPDEFDAAIMTFAEVVTVKPAARRPQKLQAAYDPFGEDLETQVNKSYGGSAPYDPFRSG